jgi:sodium/potassium-transporting ATPase subunit alpha
MDREEKRPRVHYADEEEGRIGRSNQREQSLGRRLSRASSIGSLSIGHERTVQPEAALPITYRTLSIEVDENLQQDQLKKAKDKTTAGKSSVSSR